MKRAALRRRIAAIVSAVLATVYAPSAFACACCIPNAWRYVEIEKISPQKLAEIEQMKFAKPAKLMLGEADDNGIKGVEDPQEDYQLTVTRQKDRMLFSFRDEKGRAGTLALAMPKTISIFEVDPRGRNAEEEAKTETGLGPSLYKEWKLTANAAGDGLFRAVFGAGQKMTLVLHGRGIGCTDASHFTDWTLLVYGPADKFTLYGRLDSGGR